ncbi:hypothetical protein MLOOGBEN_06650 [Bacillus sp. EB106-08-02-XG196]|uniref:hypothetical protein n=1 Tax=Bacillus sp. EB106-08-02-XG196 TaxID=2737049 RepID=UPI0015C4E598|nr:hypothetical protein [Bacillus sp. EB106-08-02-XG196]NWQ40377.1 hypothetical protein [Bacillus sp. EB106-08-02-XG196]
MIQIRYVKTIVGWFNLYVANGDPKPPVTISPAKMSELFPEISKKAKFGCGEISAIQAAILFGRIIKEVRSA